MAFRTWGKLLLTALGASLLAGAIQLGIAFGFGIVRLTGAFTGDSVNQWPAQLTWVGWIAANAAVAGAIGAERLARRDGLLTGIGRQAAVAGAATLGAIVVAPLCMQPARAADLVTAAPVWAVATCAVLGAVAGGGAALAVLARPPLGWSVALVAGVVWLLALISVAPSLGETGPLRTVRLGVWEPSWLSTTAAHRLSLLCLPVVALLVGASTGGLARRRELPPLVGGLTGVAGPVLLAFTYLAAGSGDEVNRYQAAPYYGALLAVATGALGSAAAVVLRWPLVVHPADRSVATPGTEAAGAMVDDTSPSTNPASNPETTLSPEPPSNPEPPPNTEPTLSPGPAPTPKPAPSPRRAGRSEVTSRPTPVTPTPVTSPRPVPTPVESTTRTAVDPVPATPPRPVPTPVESTTRSAVEPVPVTPPRPTPTRIGPEPFPMLSPTPPTPPTPPVTRTFPADPPTSTAAPVVSGAAPPTDDGSDPDTQGDRSAPDETPPVARRRGLFRRHRSHPNDAGDPTGPVQLPAQDEEFVDWVTGLSKPAPDNEADPERVRRSLRSVGRHHAD
ncbi:hypothetical protein HCB17_01535 [Salinispora arenicola]|uniref:hypothetical protein n=1 Tax=Salinispora arenicola TaxID=168697 RepID=UPI00143164F2|nr:hypothetical protein [Salinispora arenicola]NIL39986.1 hypothetical protein [Salinispora arenicola]